MRKVISAICAALLSLTSLSTVGAATAAPVPSLSLEQDQAVVNVQHRGAHYRHPGRYGGAYYRRPGAYRSGYYRLHGHPYYNGYRGYNYYRPGWRAYNGWWFPPSAFVAGAIVGGAISQPPPVYTVPSGASAHVRWCYERYRSYRASDNTFQPNSGPRRQCRSPYG